jgi:chromosome segregation ATPase
VSLNKKLEVHDDSLNSIDELLKQLAKLQYESDASLSVLRTELSGGLVSLNRKLEVHDDSLNSVDERLKHLDRVRYESDASLSTLRTELSGEFVLLNQKLVDHDASLIVINSFLNTLTQTRIEIDASLVLLRKHLRDGVLELEDIALAIDQSVNDLRQEIQRIPELKESIVDICKNTLELLTQSSSLVTKVKGDLNIINTNLSSISFQSVFKNTIDIRDRETRVVREINLINLDKVV